MQRGQPFPGLLGGLELPRFYRSHPHHEQRNAIPPVFGEVFRRRDGRRLLHITLAQACAHRRHHFLSQVGIVVYGIAGLAIGFGAQTLVKDVINGFFILLENQYDIGDNIRVAGVKGTVEAMSLRSTVLRDEDGTIHIIPNSEIKIVSNATRDWSQLTLRVTVAYSEPSERIVKLLQEVGEELRHDPAYADDIVGDIEVPGIDRVGNGEVEYLIQVKTRPNQQHRVSRELRRRIKESFQQNNIQTAGPGRVYVMDQSSTG
jgi:small-conductance mechanosensitive channel